MYIYSASKALAEKAINEIGAAHPEVNIAASEFYWEWICDLASDEESITQLTQRTSSDRLLQRP